MLNKLLILQVAVPSPVGGLFDYLPPENCAAEQILVGTRILVPFGNREVIGIIFNLSSSSSLKISKLKRGISLLDKQPILPNSILILMHWVSDYYHHPIGDLINILPKLLREKRTKKISINPSSSEKEEIPSNPSNKTIFTPSEEQLFAINTIKSHLTEFKVFLLYGITGSGKTEVYLQIIEEVLLQGKQALVLVPEINLTPQTIARFSEHFHGVKIAVFHSQLTPKERLKVWLMASHKIASIIIGTRSAIFIPMNNLGIIILDEEHDLSFKQQSGLRYSARDLAVIRGKLEQIPIVLGSATPSLESIYNVEKSRYQQIMLTKRAGAAIPPILRIVDMRGQKLREGIAEGLLQVMKQHLERQGQILVFLNRRGFAPLLICHHCGWVAECRECDTRLIFHHKKHHLRCHHCGLVTEVPNQCPNCKKQKLLMVGFGTERIELFLREVFPKTAIARIDRDTVSKKNSLEKVLDDIHLNKYQILIGTQMLAKGHHFPRVTMVAILNIDQSLFSCDFRSGEHLAQLIIQVAGRAGRDKIAGEVYLQTHNPDHPLLLDLLDGKYEKFIQNCLKERRSASLPPYSYLALMQAESKDSDYARQFLQNVKDGTTNLIANSTKISGPVPNIMIKRSGYFRFQLLWQNSSRNLLKRDLKATVDFINCSMKVKSKLKWFLDVDPMELG